MKGIEQGRITEQYSVVVAPFRQVLQRSNRQDLGFLLKHDVHHFARDFAFAFQEDTPPGILEDDIVDIKTILSPRVEHLFTDRDVTPQENLTAMQHYRLEKGRKVTPYFRSYAVAIMDSMSYLEALRGSNRAEEEETLIRLSQLEVPIAPLCAYYSSQFQVDGEKSDDPTITLDGMRSIIVFNLLTNTMQHSLVTPDNMAGRESVSTTNIDSSDGKITVANLAPYPLPEDFGSWETLALYLHYGLFIAKMYAALSGLELTGKSEETGQFFTKPEGRITGPAEEKPIYKNIVTLG
jgi:hypothetical protein